MHRTSPPQPKSLPYLLIASAFGLFVAFFAAFHYLLGNEVAALAIVPISIASWYLGMRGGVVTSIASILSYIVLQAFSGKPLNEILAMPSTTIGALVFIISGYVTARIATVTQERKDAYINLARSNELIYSLVQVTTHIEKGLNPDEILQALGKELRKINLSSVIASYKTNQNSFEVSYLSLDQKQIEHLNKIIGFPLDQYTFPFRKLNPESLDIKSMHHAVASEPHQELNALFTEEEAGVITGFLRNMGVNINNKVFRLLLMFEENLLAILWVWGKEITESDLPAMSIFAKQIGISLERARLFQEVQDLALTDSLTSLYNRRGLFELGRIEFARGGRLNRPFSCMMLDLDHFKQINDTYGHQTGDRVLQEFAKQCRNSVREIDLIGRYGGEELIILMPETEVELATQVAERLRLSISDNPMIVADWIFLNVTVSIGVATKDENTLELETLIARADQAMYIAKHKGRNRVAVSK